MKFDVKVVLDCLKENREVFTVRAWESKDRYTVVEVNNVGSCVKEKICKIGSMNELIDYVSLSGFGSAQEWWNKVTEFKATEGWLYRVSVLEEETFDSPSSTITFTGNRNIRAKDVQAALQAVHEKYPNTIWRTGMAYGLDMAVAEFAAANEIPFEAHLPFPAYIQTKRWNQANQARHLELLEKAVKVFTHSQEFSIAAYQTRNVKMAEGAEMVVSFNRKDTGGTVNMIKHCKKYGIPVMDGYTLSFSEVGVRPC